MLKIGYHQFINYLKKLGGNMLNNIKQRKDSGFTIVELLIVIVIIAILAAITIVAYNGIQNRANSAAAQSAASNLSKKIEAYNAEQGTYPTATTVAAYTTALNGVTSSSLVGSDIVITGATPTAANGKTTVQVLRCSAPATVNGYQVKYLDFSTGALSTTILTGSSAACTTWTALT